MNVYEYDSYEEYVDCQKKAYKKKFQNVWAEEKNIKAICDYMRPNMPRFGICHGTRQGYEQRWFMQYLIDCHVVGSEIGGHDDEYTVEWDFNKENTEWVDTFDFIYSNSFDHAFNPEKTFNVWVGQVKSGGLIIFEYDRRQEHTGEISKKWNRVDPVSMTVDELMSLAPTWNKRIGDIVVLDMPVVTQEWRKAIVFHVN